MKTMQTPADGSSYQEVLEGLGVQALVVLEGMEVQLTEWRM